MAINLKQLPDGSAGLEGSTDLGNGAFLTATVPWVATSANSVVFVAPRTMVVQSIAARVETAGTDVGVVTAVVNKAASGTAITAGTALHAGSINLKGTAATNQALVVATLPSTVRMAAGDSIGIVFTGVLTAASGSVTVAFNPA